MIRAGVDRTVAKRISGHKTDSMFERYNIVEGAQLRDAMLKTAAHVGPISDHQSKKASE